MTNDNNHIMSPFHMLEKNKIKRFVIMKIGIENSK